jgi:hypothetical protein
VTLSPRAVKRYGAYGTFIFVTSEVGTATTALRARSSDSRRVNAPKIVGIRSRHQLRIRAMTNPIEARYEDYLHKGSDPVALSEEIAWREKAGWSVWSIDPVGAGGVLVRFKHPSEWAPELPDP